MPTTLTNGIQLPDKGSVDWYNSMQSNYNLIDTHLGDTDTHVTAEDKANWNSKQGSLSQAQLDAIAQVATNTDDIASLQSGKANASHTHSSSDITDIGDYATKQYVDNSISGLVDNAPAALDTLKELSTALNDDANFASTVTTALSAKANSADLATVATSGSYNDLSNKPTINDSTITVQKNGSTVDTFTTNGSNKTINIPVPTKTSDLTNDSNFVDTSNSAVASGITSAKVTDYDTHIADTDIHVTTADKNKWNNQTYVFRYSSTALTPSSTNSNTLLDNTDNLKVGDKVIDSSGVLFSITAIDTANSTFTIGTALIDLAQDSDVVHKSGNETVGGQKTLENLLPLKGEYLGTEASNNGRSLLYFLANRDTQNQSGIFLTKFRQNKAQGSMSGNDVAYLSFDCLENSVRTNNGLRINFLNFVNDIPQQFVLWSGITERLLGVPGSPWSDVYANKINGLNPSSLGMPDLNNGIDISSYITISQPGVEDVHTSTYTPTVNGFISVCLSRNGVCGVGIEQGDMRTYAREVPRTALNTRYAFAYLPVVKNVQVNIISCYADGIVSAKFFPCLGNV